MSGYRCQSEDVSEAVDRQMFAGLRELTPQQRWQIAREATMAIERLSIAGLREQYPAASEQELWRRAAARRLGAEVLRRYFGSTAEAWLD